jgi:hypothetical protein
MALFNHRAGTAANGWLRYAPPLAITFFLIVTLWSLPDPAKADSFTGAGEVSATQTRSWTVPANWASGVIPLGNDQNTFRGAWIDGTGDGTVQLNGMQSAGALMFGDFTYTTITSGLIPSSLKMVDSINGFTFFQMGEGVRDTYGVDYFTAGPNLNAGLIFNNIANYNVDVFLGNLLGNGANSSMMISGSITNNVMPPGVRRDTLTYTGYGSGTSLWISSNNTFNSSIFIKAASPGAGVNGYTLHLVDSGRMNNSMLTLSSAECYLGLHDNTGGTYTMTVYDHQGNVFADRSYQLNDLDATINAQEYLTGQFQVFNSANFGMASGQTGRTNNGFTTRVTGLYLMSHSEQFPIMVYVNNGNLTDERGGSRYISGANRLQEAHNYTYVDCFFEYFDPTIFWGKSGSGVLAIDLLNYTPPGQTQLWSNTPLVYDGVLRLGTPANPHKAPSVLVSSNAGLGLGWNTNIDLRGVWGGGVLPFPVKWLGIGPGAGPPGQDGAIDIDLWNHNAGIIDTNVLGAMQNLSYMRVGSSKGGDASFDTQPQSAKHASVAFLTLQGTPTQIVPYIVQTAPIDVYYFGGGGGTLQVDTQLYDYTEEGNRTSMLEMGTTGTLLPGRVALNPGGDINPEEPNLYTGPTEICAGTLQLMKQNSVYGTAMVHVWTYDLNITNALYANPGPFHHPLWEGTGNYSWTGPGQLLLDPGRDLQMPGTDWSLFWYKAQGGGPLFNALSLDGGVIGWTGNVDLPSVPGNYGATITSNLNPNAPAQVNVLGLGGEYSAGTMTTHFNIADGPQGVIPVLLYKAGKNSVLDLRQSPVAGPGPLDVNTYTGGTIIAGGEIIIDDARQLNAAEGGNGGPIAILNGGRLHFAKSSTGSPQIFMNAPIKINTAGTPDVIENCGSVIEVDGGVTAWLFSNFDFSWNPTAYLEKDGSGLLAYSPWAPMVVGSNPANAWGLKLTAGLVETNQLPVNPGSDSGPVIFNNGNLRLTKVTGNIGVLDHDPAYGFRNIVSFKGTSSTVYVDDNTMFRTHGIVPNEILGTVKFVGNDLDLDTTNNVIHLSRNMAPATANPGDYSRGTGAMTFENVTVYTSSDASGALNVFPHEAGFVLQLNDGATLYANAANYICGEVNFNNTNPNNSNLWVRIDGENTTSPTPVGIGGPPYQFSTTPDTWHIFGTAYTSWSGVTEKVGSGRVLIYRALGAAVSVNSNTLLKISGGTFEAAGKADPFTDTTTGLSMDIINDSTALGLVISDGVKNVDQLTGAGNTTVSGVIGTELYANKIMQTNLTIGAGCKVTINPIPGGPSASGDNLTPVPEPATWILLILAAAGLASRRVRAHARKNGA